MGLTLAFVLNILVQSLAPVLVGMFLSPSDPLYAQTLHVAVADVRVITLGMFIMAPMYLYRIAIQTLGHSKIPYVCRIFTTFSKSIFRFCAACVYWRIRILCSNCLGVGGYSSRCNDTLL